MYVMLVVFSSHMEISSLCQPCYNLVKLLQDCHEVVNFHARCSQPCRVVRILLDGCDILDHTVKLHAIVKMLVAMVTRTKLNYISTTFVEYMKY